MTRKHGVVDSAAGLAPFGHFGWAYRDRSEFFELAGESIAYGLAANQLVQYVGEGTHEQLRAELAAIPGLTDFDLGDVRVTPALEFYCVPSGDVIDPEVAVTAALAAIQNAIDDGYSGFRAIADVTQMVMRPEQQEAFARFEFLIDRNLAELPVSGLCAYDMSRLDGAASGLVCLHPLVGDGAPAFRIYAEPGAAFALDGEIDVVEAATFTTTLRRIWDVIGDGDVVIDVRNIEFIDHQQMLGLDELARQEGRRVVLHGGPPIITRLTELLDLTNVRVDPVSPGAYPT